MPGIKMENRWSRRALTPCMQNAAGYMKPDRSQEPKRKQSHLSPMIGLLISADKKNSDQQMGYTKEGRSKHILYRGRSQVDKGK